MTEVPNFIINCTYIFVSALSFMMCCYGIGDILYKIWLLKDDDTSE